MWRGMTHMRAAHHLMLYQAILSISMPAYAYECKREKGRERDEAETDRQAEERRGRNTCTDRQTKRKALVHIGIDATNAMSFGFTRCYSA